MSGETLRDRLAALERHNDCVNFDDALLVFADWLRAEAARWQHDADEGERTHRRHGNDLELWSYEADQRVANELAGLAASLTPTPAESTEEATKA